MQTIKHLRRKKRVRQSDLAEAIGVSLRTIQLYERKDANIPIKNLTKIADYFDTTIAELYIKEVNESGEPYLTTNVFSGRGTFIRHLSNGKVLVRTPLVLIEKQKAFLEKYELSGLAETLPQMEFLVNTAFRSNHMAFEIGGNSMDDGTVQAIPAGTLVLTREIEPAELVTTPKEFLNKSFVLVGRDRIFCKSITAISKEKQTVLCHSRNPSPEYKDFIIPISQILGFYQVIKKQL
ncbi:MAG: helix-turn-helix transcriptional regulator [Bacteroidota bacterium]